MACIPPIDFKAMVYKTPKHLDHASHICQVNHEARQLPPMASTIIPIVAEVHFHHFSISKDETNAAIMSRMRELSVRDSPVAHKSMRNIRNIILMRQPAVGMGLVLKVSTL